MNISSLSNPVRIPFITLSPYFLLYPLPFSLNPSKEYYYKIGGKLMEAEKRERGKEEKEKPQI